jgi:hypothetical protein
MTAKTELSVPKRRIRAEVQQLVAEPVSSGMRRSEFCRSRRLSIGTLNRHLKKQRWKRKRKKASAVGQFMPVELTTKKSVAELGLTVPLVVVLSSGRRIEVLLDFDTSTFERVVGILERE